MNLRELRAALDAAVANGVPEDAPVVAMDADRIALAVDTAEPGVIHESPSTGALFANPPGLSLFRPVPALILR